MAAGSRGIPRLKGRQINARQRHRGEQRKSDYQEEKIANNEGNRVPTHVEMWKERRGRTPTGGESQSVDDQGHATVIYVEMWKE